MNATPKSRLLLRGAAAAVTVLLLCLSGPAAAADDASYVGEKPCLQCHETSSRHYGHTLHARIFRLNPKTEAERRGCEACHGPGSKHIANPTEHGTLIGFTREWGTPIALQNAKCMECHAGGQRLHWPNSIHQINQLGCSDCHNPMARYSENGLLAANSITETCQTCHQQQRAEFRRRSHMPVPEGKMSCVDCHNPHGAVTRPLLKADTVNNVCYNCHTEKRGPFIWEHAPVRANCLNCHHPHGSNHDVLLRFARPALCEQCHSPSVGHPGQFFRNDQTALSALQGGTPSQRVIGRSCANCHTTVHGSNHPSGARLQR